VTSPESALVRMSHVTKRFPGVVANDQVDFDVMAGEIHGLLGENGAGKTTLMNILSGLSRPDVGDIYVKGQKVSLKSPKDAIEEGIFMVHQHFMLIPNLTVAENVILGARQPREPLLDIEKVEKKISVLANSYGLEINPRARLWQLSAGERQKVEILKALYRSADILILDEPTSNLSPVELKTLSQMLVRMKGEGKGIIFITHKIYEALELADRVTVLRRGKVIGTLRRDEAEQKELVKMMIGHEVPELYRRELSRAASCFQVRDLVVGGDMGVDAVRGVDFEICSGEIFGIAGVAGNGQSELVEAIAGLRKVVKGRIAFEGKDITHYTPDRLYAIGLYHIPEKRVETGIAPDANVAENLALGNHSSYVRNFLLDYKAMANGARELIKSYGVMTPSESSTVNTLSGGNIQKLIVARCISMSPKLLIASNPTAGLDVSATHFVHEKLLELRDKRTGILLVSSDLDELLMLCDRIAVMYRGRIAGVVKSAEAVKEEIGEMMMGSGGL